MPGPTTEAPRVLLLHNGLWLGCAALGPPLLVVCENIFNGPPSAPFWKHWVQRLSILLPGLPKPSHPLTKLHEGKTNRNIYWPIYRTGKVESICNSCPWLRSSSPARLAPTGCGGRELTTRDRASVTSYIPHISPDTHLSTIPNGKMNSQVDSAPTVQAGNENQFYRFVVRDRERNIKLNDFFHNLWNLIR